MRTIPDIVKEFVLKTQGRMPETDEEVDQYLDLINHMKEYSDAVRIERAVGAKYMKKLGLRTPAEIREAGMYKK